MVEVIDRDEIINEAIKVFGKAWNFADKEITALKIGSRRKAGLHAVFDILERDYIVTKRDDND